MRNITARLALAVMSILPVFTWSDSALAAVTISGTVGELGVLDAGGNGGAAYFKLTDASQTATCQSITVAAGVVVPVKSAYVSLSSGNQGRELYALLLLSKKGAPISCQLQDGSNCVVRSCTLP